MFGRVALAVLFAVVLVVSSLALVDLRRASAAGPTTLRVGMIEPIDSLNPYIGVTDNAYIFWGYIYDYLIAVDQDLNPKPNLAKSWYPLPDAEPFGSVWQYNLTHEAKWHDGEPFDANDVVFTIEMQTGLNFATVWAYQPYTALIDYAEKMEDDYTVRIHYKDLAGNPSPCSFADALMIPILPQHIWGLMSVPESVFDFENFKPIGTGPFMCTDDTEDEFKAGDPLILLRNDDYHGAVEYGETVDFERLILMFYLEPSAMFTDIQRGAIDLAAFNAANYELLDAWLEDNPTEPVGTYAGLQCTGFSVEISVCMKQNDGNNLRTDPAVRRAMAYATDKEFINNNIYRGYGEIGSTIFSPVYGDAYWTPGPDEIYEFDLTKANASLDAGGYIWHDDGFRYSSDDEYYPTPKKLSFEVVIEEELMEDRDTFTIMREDYGKVGIELVPRYVSVGQWSTLVYDYLFDLTLTYWSGDPDPSYLLYTQTSYCIDDWSENAYDNPCYDENYSRYVNTTNEELKLEYIHNCQELMYNDSAFIVYSYPYGCWAWRTDSFSGWGDWEAHPGRQLANFWTSNPLYYDLVPLDKEGGGISGTVLLVIVCAAVVIVVVVVLLMLKRKGQSKEEDVRLP